jgi:hypothetical protein
MPETKPSTTLSCFKVSVIGSPYQLFSSQSGKIAAAHYQHGKWHAVLLKDKYIQ